jgi:hypothetical protein
MWRRWGGALIVGLAWLGVPAPATAGTYDVVSCGAPGANGVNNAWQITPFDDRFWDVAPGCPELLAWSERRRDVVVPNFTGAGYELSAPAGATLDRMVIWRTGYRFNNTGTAQGPWAVGGYRADGSVIGGPLTGETCNFPTGRLDCRFGTEGAMSPGSRVERDLETTKVLYSVACFDPPGCRSANEQGFPFAGLSISGSIITVREETGPSVVARGALTEPGWHTDDPPLDFGASDPVGIRQLRVLVDGAEIHDVRPPCDFTRMAPCGQVPERAVAFGAGVPDGQRTLTVEATDTAGNVSRVDRPVAVDRNPPALAFLPTAGHRRIALSVADPGSGATGGTIEVRRRRGQPFRALATTIRGGRLVARLASGSPARMTIRASATDAVGHRAELVGAPVRLRAGFGSRLRDSVRRGLERGAVLRGRLTALGGRALAGRQITVTQTLRADGAAPEVAGTAVTGRRGRFRVRVPAGASRVLRVRSPGTGGLQAAQRTLRFRVPWSSTLRIAPERVAPGGRIRLSGRLRLRGAVLPRSGTRVELQAFDRGRWRVFATTVARGRRAAWRASYRFGTRPGSYRIRVRIPHDGSIPYERGYSRPRTVVVG